MGARSKLKSKLKIIRKLYIEKSPIKAHTQTQITKIKQTPIAKADSFTSSKLGTLSARNYFFLKVYIFFFCCLKINEMLTGLPQWEACHEISNFYKKKKKKKKKK